MNYTLEDSLGFLISRTSLKMKNNLQHGLKPFDITSEQWGILNRLWEKDGVSQRAISEKSCKDQANITRILDKLEEKKLIERHPDPDDRRAFLIYLTEEGKGLKKTLIPVAQAALKKALVGITEDEQRLLKELLNRIYDNLDQE